MLGRADGAFFTFLIFVTSFLGSLFILFPFIPLAYFHPKSFRWCADRFVGYWLTFPASLCEYFFGCRFHVSGDFIDHTKPAILIMNHRTRLDWLFLWNALYKMNPWLLTSEKISLKAGLKKIPGAGWAMGCGAFIFLERKFDIDQEIIARNIKYYKQTGQTYQLLLFPEGTDRDTKSIAHCNAYAEKHGLPAYDYVLHPRTTGFVHLIELMKNENYLANIYDLTIGYPDRIVQSEIVLFKEGVFPGNIHFDVKKYSIEDIPSEKDAAAKWLSSLWSDKEKRLRQFYEETKQFEPSGERYVWPSKTLGIGYIAAFLVWVLSSFMWIYFIIAYSFVKVYALLGIFFYLYALKYHNGVDALIVKWMLEQKEGVSSEKLS